MDSRYWNAAATVMEFVAGEGSGDRVVAYHRRGIRQLARHLEESGEECTRDAVSRWLADGRLRWSKCKHKQNRTAALRLLEALETGSVSPSPYSHPGPTDYSRLSGWSKVAVDSYADDARRSFSDREGYLARMYASRFMVRSGLDDASPGDVTAEAVLAYVVSCGGTKCVRAARLSHLRGFLSHLHVRGDAPAWIALLASDYFASHADCYGQLPGLEEAGGLTPDECLSMVGPFVEMLEGRGYSHTRLKSAAKAVRMLCVALATNGVGYTPANGRAWLDGVRGLVGTQGPCFRRSLDLFARFASGSPMEFSVAARNDSPMGALPPWARDAVSSYLDLRRREGCTDGTLGCTRRACARFASYAAHAGVESWADLDGAVVAGWCASDSHETAEGLACYVTKVRGLLAYLGDEGVVARNLWLAARSTHAPSRKVVDVLGGGEVASADARRLSASTPIELRDAALVALGLTMGLRSCDVLALEMSSISWADSTISLVQRKTGAPLRLPLTLQAGNALVAYLRGGRPRSDSPLVFVKHRAPYDGLTKSACHDAMIRTFGPGVTAYHMLRRTFATSMLRAGSGRSEVAEALGHRTELSTEPYLALDPGRMRMCALPMGELAIGGGHVS